MREIHVHLADQEHADTPVEPATIHIDLPQPHDRGTDWAARARQRHCADALALADALWSSLPGAVVDELLGEMLSRRAPQLRVRMPAPPADNGTTGGAQ